MTLIFTGHNLSFDNGQTKSNGLFVASDSAIASILGSGKEHTLITSGFEKVYPLPISVYKPSFNADYDGGYFTGYNSTCFEHTGFIAIAGGTLVLQHVMNLINTHMKKLRISLINEEYKIIRHCEHNPLEKNRGLTYYSNNTFTDNDYIGLNTADTYFEHIKYSIETATESFKPKKIINQVDVERMNFEIAIGLYCDVTKEHLLKIYTCKPKRITDGEWEFDVNIKNVLKDEVAVLGIQDNKDSANSLISELIKKGESLPCGYFDFLNKCIVDNNSDSNLTSSRFAISYPSVLYELELNQLSKIKYFDGNKASIFKSTVDKRKFTIQDDL